MNDQNKLRVFLVIILALIVPLSLTGLLNPYPRTFSDVFRPMIEIPTAVCEQLESIRTGKYWKITVTVKNSDKDAVEFLHVLVEDVPVSSYNMPYPVEGEAVTNMLEKDSINPGITRNFELFIDGDYGNFTSGKVIKIKLRSLWGTDHIKLVKLT